jgi:Flp pilus assembly protein TadD
MAHVDLKSLRRLKMKMALIALVAVAAATPVSAQEYFGQPGGEPLPVAYADLQAGRTDAALKTLAQPRGVEASDPSRLINLGSALARKGRFTEAAAQYRAAMASDVRYELELADGRWMDSREAAKLALSRLNQSMAMNTR